jgi:SAM-dependent methyltransferase
MLMPKSIARAITPPVLWAGATRIAAYFRGKPEEQAGEKDAAWYDCYYSRFRDDRSHYSQSQYYFLYALVVDRLLRAGVDSVLEVGCGRGCLATVLRDKGFRNYCGFDFSEEQISAAKKNCPEFTFHVADAFSTNLFEGDYEAVTCTEFLEHVEGDLEIIARVKKGALFVGSVPNFPFVSHVRHFDSSADVIDRYSMLFDNFRVDPFVFKAKGGIIYIIEGTVK